MTPNDRSRLADALGASRVTEVGHLDPLTSLAVPVTDPGADCDHGSDPRCCPVCLGPSQVPSSPDLDHGRARPAQWPGSCGWCGHDIEVGQLIVRAERVWVHDHCAEEDR